MSKRSRYLDEDDVRVRTGRGGSRPRTRRRPTHEDAPEGFVVSVDRGRYGCLVAGSGSGSGDRMVTAMKARELGRNSIVVGDRVSLAGDTSGSPGSLARVVRVADRSTVLRRSPDDTDPSERIVVANADQMVIVCALADPEPKTRFVDRCLVAAYDAGLSPLLVLTKSDLAPPRKMRAFYRPLGFPMLTVRQPLPAATRTRLNSALNGRISVLIGQSGVGKSTLVNGMVPDADRAIGRVNAVTGKGRHTSSSAVALRLPSEGTIPLRGTPQHFPGGYPPDPQPPQLTGGLPVPPSPPGGWLIDTPGVRGFGLGHITPDRVVEAFGDLADGIENCPPGCDHLDHLSGDCALDEWAEANDAGPRLDSLRRLLATRNDSALD